LFIWQSQSIGVKHRQSSLAAGGSLSRGTDAARREPENGNHDKGAKDADQADAHGAMNPETGSAPIGYRMNSLVDTKPCRL